MRERNGRSQGATTVEYALMIAAFAAAIIFVLTFLGNTINHAKSDVAGAQPGEVRVDPDDGGAGKGGRFIHTR